jgi:hypothetical protein
LAHPCGNPFVPAVSSEGFAIKLGPAAAMLSFGGAEKTKKVIIMPHKPIKYTGAVLFFSII